MKSWLIKILASQALKLGVAYAHRSTILAVDAINGLLAAGNLDAETVKRLEKIAKALVVLGRFLEKAAEYIGAPDMGELRAYRSTLDQLDDAVDKLERINRAL